MIGCILSPGCNFKLKFHVMRLLPVAGFGNSTLYGCAGAPAKGGSLSQQATPTGACGASVRRGADPIHNREDRSPVTNL